MSVVVGHELGAVVESLARRGEALHVEANLQLTVDGTELAVSSHGDRLRVQLPSVGACLPLLRSAGGRVQAIARALDAADLTVELRTGDAVLAVIGAAARPGFVASALSLGRVELRVGGLVAGLVRFR